MRSASQDRTITNTANVIMALVAMASTCAVWFGYYNDFVFRTYRMAGGVVSMAIYVAVYLLFARVYRAFKIASFPIMETGFSQCLALGIADVFIYVEGCLIYRQYINILPGAVTAAVQFVLAFVWATLVKQYFLKHVEPQECVMVYHTAKYSRGAAELFVKKIEAKYGHLFRIDKSLPAEALKELDAALRPYPVLFLFGVEGVQRSRIFNYASSTGKKLYMVPTIEDVLARGFQVKHLIDTPLFAYESHGDRPASYPGKRLIDIVLSLLMLLVTFPIMLVTALCIKLEDHGDVFFRQKRYTAGGKVFEILKFRSMVMDAETDGKPRPCTAGDSRVTKVGKIIRATRIDELPQIFNILSGDMSWVGPRPERIEHVDLFARDLPEFNYRLRVRAGLTGYAQIYGKYNTTARDKLLLDLLYIEQQSFVLDVKIFFMTIKTMFTPEAAEGFDEARAKAINARAAEEKEIVNA